MLQNTMCRYKHGHVLVGDEWKTQKILGKCEKKHFSNTSFHCRFFLSYFTTSKFSIILNKDILDCHDISPLNECLIKEIKQDF